MKLTSFFAAVLLAGGATLAHADSVQHFEAAFSPDKLTHGYGNSASFAGDLTFSDDYSSISAVQGSVFLNGGLSPYEAINVPHRLFTDTPEDYLYVLVNGGNFHYALAFGWTYIDGLLAVNTKTTTIANGTYPSSLLSFSITPVPEADTWAMLLAGLGMLGFVARRRSCFASARN